MPTYLTDSIKLSRLLIVTCLGLQIALPNYGVKSVQASPEINDQTNSRSRLKLRSCTLLNWGVFIPSTSTQTKPPEAGWQTNELELAKTNGISLCNHLLDPGFVENGTKSELKWTATSIDVMGNMAKSSESDRILPPPSPTCPSDLETLTFLLLRDLPSYANRIVQRARRLDRSVDEFSYVIIAGRPEFEPLPLNPGESSFTPTVNDPHPPQQLFFTTLERQYSGGKAIESQSFHWLFLTQTESGWRLAMIFTQLGASSKAHPPMPPRESSNSIIGQGVTIWLRDCRGGGIRRD